MSELRSVDDLTALQILNPDGNVFLPFQLQVD